MCVLAIENIRYMDNCGYNFVTMVKRIISWVRELILGKCGTFKENCDCHIRDYRLLGNTS